MRVSGTLRAWPGVAEGESGALAGSAQVGAVGGLGRVGEEPVDLACDVAFEAADDLAAGFAVGASALGVVDGALVDAQPGDGDAPQGVVGVAVEAVAHGGAW